MIRARDIFLLAVLLPLFFSSSLTAVSQDNLVLEIRRSYFEKIVWSTDGTSIFLVDDDEIQRFDDQFNLLDSANIGYSQAVSFSPNGNLIALLRWDGTIELWNTEGWVYVRELPTKGQSIIRTRWHPGGDTIAILRANANAIEIWDISSLQVIETITVGPDETIRAFEWSPTGDRIAIAFSDSTIAVWDTVSEQISVMFHEHIGEISDVQWSPNGDWIASSDVVHDCHSRIGAFAVWVWDASTGEPLHSFDTLHCSHANPLTWSPDSKYLAATTESGLAPFFSWQTRLKIWDISSGETISDWQISDKDSVVDLAWQPNGDAILFRTGFSSTGGFLVCASPLVGLIDSSDADLIRYEPPSYTGSIYDIGWHSSEPLFAAAGNDRNIYVWNSETSDLATTLSAHPCTVTHLAWHPTLSLLASTGSGGDVLLWDVRVGNVSKTSEFNWSNVDQSQTFAWDSSGSQLLAFDFDGRGRIWNSELGVRYDFQLPFEIPFATVHSVNWRAEVPVIAIGSNPIQLWLATEMPFHTMTFPKSTSNPVQIQWDHSGELLASLNENGTIDIWDSEGRLRNTLSFQHEIDRFLWYPQADWLAVADSGTLLIYDVMTGDLVDSFDITGGLLTWNPAGTSLASVDVSAIQVWETIITR